ncbi:MAG: tripartite tricarboxylate transporter TctB family protein [Microbacteriaceae bacterium]
MKRRRTKKGGSAANAEEPSGSAGSVDEVSAPSLTEGISEEELALVEEMEREVAALQAPSSRRLERAIALTLVVLSALGVFGSRIISVRTETGGLDPRWWPTVICAISLGLSMLLTVIAYTRPPFDRDDLERTNREGWIKLAWSIILLALYIVAWTLSENFVVPSVVLLAALMWVYHGRTWMALVIYPIVTVTFLYLLFHSLLRVPL